jgi:hypothetical protein
VSRTLRPRFWLEAVLSSASGLLGILTLVWRDWIEAVFRFDPDHHSGGVEWLIVLGLLAVAATTALLARIEWGRAAPEGSRG